MNASMWCDIVVKAFYLVLVLIMWKLPSLKNFTRYSCNIL